MSEHVLYYSSNCPDTAPFVEELKRQQIEYRAVDIIASMANLKEFLRLRDDKPQFAERKKWGMVGVPCFVTKDGQYIFELGELAGTSCEAVPFDK